MVTGGVVTELVWLQSWSGYRGSMVTEVVWLQSWCGYRAGQCGYSLAMAANSESKAHKIVTLSTYF